jgi:hypothetical protein
MLNENIFPIPKYSNTPSLPLDQGKKKRITKQKKKDHHN